MTVATAPPPVRPPRRHPVRSSDNAAVSQAQYSSSTSGPVPLGRSGSLARTEVESPPRDYPSSTYPPHPAGAAPISSPPESNSSSTPFSFRSRLARQPFDAVEPSSDRAGLAGSSPANDTGAHQQETLPYATGWQLFGPTPSGLKACEESGAGIGGAGETASDRVHRRGWRAAMEQGTPRNCCRPSVDGSLRTTVLTSLC